MAYKQNFGKTASTGHGQIFQDKGLVSPMHNDKDKDKKKDTKSGNEYVDVQTNSGLDSYNISVVKDSPYHKQSKEFGGRLPGNMRLGGKFTEATDPWTSNISAEEKQKRKDDYNN